MVGKQCYKPLLAATDVELHKQVQGRHSLQPVSGGSLKIKSMLNRRYAVCARIESCVVEHTVTISVIGRFDLSLNTALWAASRWHRDRFDNYIIQLNGVTELRDSGLAWMMMFQRKVRAQHAILRVSGGLADIAARCKAAGLDA